MSTNQSRNGDDVAARATPGKAGTFHRIGTVLAQLPTLLVLGALAAVGWWGHHTGWKAPHLSELTKRAAAEKEDWCRKHNVPDSRCIKCHPELLGESKKDWCPEHGVLESKCTLCHPEILRTGVAGDWCPEHGVPESNCTICHPEVAVKGMLPADENAVRVTQNPVASDSAPAAATRPGEQSQTIAPLTARGRSPENRVFDPARRGEIDFCHRLLAVTSRPAKDPKTCQTHALKVQFASAAAVRKAGVRLGFVTQRPIRAVVSAPSEAEYDQTRVVQISAPVSGRVWRVDHEVGEHVPKGEVVALLDSVEVGKVKAELLEQLAEMEFKTKSYERNNQLSGSGITSKATLEQAAADMRVASVRVFNARQTLANMGLSIDQQKLESKLEESQIRFLGLPPEVVKTLDVASITANLIPLRSPIEGTVILRQTVAGEMVEPNKMLFTVADTRKMWVNINVPQPEIRDVAVGQTATFRPDGVIDQSWRGLITWISTTVDDQMRTVRARALVENGDGKLLARTFGTSEILLRQADRATALPNEAIQWEGCCHIVFVRLTDDIFAVRKVKLGASDANFTEVKVGVLPGEVVATTGSHVLKSEILKSALGAGCCAVE